MLLEEEVNFTCPILVPSEHFVTERIIYSYQLNNRQAGVSILLGNINLEKDFGSQEKEELSRKLSLTVRCKT